jgi:hypothetical protein
MHFKSHTSSRKPKPTTYKTFRQPVRGTVGHVGPMGPAAHFQHQAGMRNLFHNISAKVRDPKVSAKDLAIMTLVLLAGGMSYKLLAEADAGVTSDAISQYHLTGRTDTTWGDEMAAKLNASISKTHGGKTRRRRSRK